MPWEASAAGFLLYSAIREHQQKRERGKGYLFSLIFTCGLRVPVSHVVYRRQVSGSMSLPDCPDAGKCPFSWLSYCCTSFRKQAPLQACFTLLNCLSLYFLLRRLATPKVCVSNYLFRIQLEHQTRSIRHNVPLPHVCHYVKLVLFTSRLY